MFYSYHMVHQEAYGPKTIELLKFHCLLNVLLVFSACLSIGSCVLIADGV